MSTYEDLKKLRNGFALSLRPEFDARLAAYVAEKDETIKELAEMLADLAEFWKHGTPVHPGSDIANEAIAQLAALRSEGKIP